MTNLIEKLKRHKNKKNGNREKVKTITWNCFAQLLSKYILKPCEMEVSPGSRGCMSNGAKTPPQSSDSQVKVLPSKHPWLPAWNLLGQRLGGLGLPSVCRTGDRLQGDLKNPWNKIIHCCPRGSKKKNSWEGYPLFMETQVLLIRISQCTGNRRRPCRSQCTPPHSFLGWLDSDLSPHSAWLPGVLTQAQPWLCYSLHSSSSRMRSQLATIWAFVSSKPDVTPKKEGVTPASPIPNVESIQMRAGSEGEHWAAASRGCKQNGGRERNTKWKEVLAPQTPIPSLCVQKASSSISVLCIFILPKIFHTQNSIYVHINRLHTCTHIILYVNIKQSHSFIHTFNHPFKTDNAKGTVTSKTQPGLLSDSSGAADIPQITTQMKLY